MAALISCILFFSCLLKVSFLQATFSYADQSNWPDICKTGRQQSPINIEAAVVKKFPPFVFENYDRDIFNKAILKNSGRSLDIILPTEQTELAFISGSDLPTRYKATSIQLHWGAQNRVGSEHQKFGYVFPMEMHIVHEEVSAVDQNNIRRAVFAVFYEKSPARLYTNFSSIADQLINVKAASQQQTLPTLNLRRLLPVDLTLFHRYDGSLTMPTCDENVIWTVFHRKQYITESQINALRLLEAADGAGLGTFLSGNTRRVQPLNGRIVYTSMAVKGKASFELIVLILSFFIATAVQKF